VSGEGFDSHLSGTGKLPNDPPILPSRVVRTATASIAFAAPLRSVVLGIEPRLVRAARGGAEYLGEGSRAALVSVRPGSLATFCSGTSAVTGYHR
jgi:hypothetical protein